MDAIHSQAYKKRRLSGNSSFGDLVFDSINTLIMVIVLLLTLYPFVNMLAVSLNEGSNAAAGNIYLWPRVFSLDSYIQVFQSSALLDSAFVTVARTVTGTLTSVFCSAVLAYALSKKYLIGQKYYFMFFIFSMLFSGGLIPTYLLYRSIHLIDKFAVYIVPGLISMGTVLLIIMFFRELPAELEESAKMDGANDFLIFLRIYLPLSMPCLATMALFSAVGHWNSWFDSMIYTNNRKLQVLQLILQKIVTQSQTAALFQARVSGDYSASATPETIKAAITIVTTIPIIMVYPFLQKYFVKGIIIGAIKG